MSRAEWTTGPVLPGAWLGIVGGGQLGRMFCFAAQAMGYRVLVLDPDSDSPAGAVADRHLIGAYDSPDALAEMAAQCDAVTTEFENVPAPSLAFLAQHTRVAPAAQAVSVAQDRVAEKRFLAACVGVAPHLVIASNEALAAVSDADFAPVLPGIVKTARMGYDGKGQVRVATPDEARAAFASFDGAPCVLEKRLSLAYELSALVARGADGQTVVYPVAQNVHHDGILAETMVPSPALQGDGTVASNASNASNAAAGASLAARVAEEATRIAAALDYVGVLCVEFFVLQDGSLVANEMAPRPHNSGHYTIDACVTSQFEQQVRAMAGLPLGSTRQHSAAVMLNILGDSWFMTPTESNGKRVPVASETTKTASPEATDPPWASIAAMPEAHLHLYGKAVPRPARKMGHVTLTGVSIDEVKSRARDAGAVLGIPVS